MSKIEQLIDEIESYIASCKPQAFSNNKKIVVDKDEIEDLLQELRHRTPDEIKKYQKIINNQEAILSNAKDQADAMLEEATKQTNEMIDEHEIMQQAYARARGAVLGVDHRRGSAKARLEPLELAPEDPPAGAADDVADHQHRHLRPSSHFAAALSPRQARDLIFQKSA